MITSSVDPDTISCSAYISACGRRSLVTFIPSCSVTNVNIPDIMTITITIPVTIAINITMANIITISMMPITTTFFVAITITYHL